MMPVKHIRETAIKELYCDGIEKLGALLEHHEYRIEIRNNFISDCGDRWIVELIPSDFDDVPEEERIEATEPTLQMAIVSCLEQLEKSMERENKPKENKP